MKKGRRFHCKKLGCTETFPKKAALLQHMETIHIEKAVSPLTDEDAIRKFKSAIKEALADELPKIQSKEKSSGKAERKSLLKKRDGGRQHHPQDNTEKGNDVSSRVDKGSDISQQGQVVMMVWAADDGGEEVKK